MVAFVGELAEKGDEIRQVPPGNGASIPQFAGKGVEGGEHLQDELVFIHEIIDGTIHNTAIITRTGAFRFDRDQGFRDVLTFFVSAGSKRAWGSI
jgi:hypothetical protein